MARKQANFTQQQARLRLKQEQLTLRVKIEDAKAKHAQVTNQLKATGGRIR